MYQIELENETWLVGFTDLGVLKVKNKIEEKKSFDIHLFKNQFRYLYAEWDVVPNVFLTPDAKYLVVTYGIGYVYFILLAEKRIEKFFQLFPDINYEDNSFEEVDMCCYYEERTQVDFSNTGRYAAIRVRGIYDPQEADGREVIFTPVYFSSIFIIDLFHLEICFQEDYSDVQEENKNLASIAFSPNDNYIAMGALGTVVKVFCIASGECLGKFSSLVWIADPREIRDCPLITFLDENNFMYLNHNNEIVKVSLQENGHFVQSGIIKVVVSQPDAVAEGLDKWKHINKIKLKKDEIIYYTTSNRGKCQEKWKLCFDDM